jgi:hypothetical protein
VIGDSEAAVSDRAGDTFGVPDDVVARSRLPTSHGRPSAMPAYDDPEQIAREVARHLF